MLPLLWKLSNYFVIKLHWTLHWIWKLKLRGWEMVGVEDNMKNTVRTPANSAEWAKQQMSTHRIFWHLSSSREKRDCSQGMKRLVKKVHSEKHISRCRTIKPSAISGLWLCCELLTFINGSTEQCWGWSREGTDEVGTDLLRWMRTFWCYGMADILKTCEQATEEKITRNSKCERNHSTGSHNQGKKPKQNETKKSQGKAWKSF